MQAYVLSLYQPLLDKSFLVLETFLHNPSDVLSHSLLPILFLPSMLTPYFELQTLKPTAGFDSPATDHPYMKIPRGREARSPWPSGRRLVTLRRQTSAPFCVTRHTTLSCDLKCGVLSYSRRNMIGPVPVRLVSMPPVPMFLSLVLLWELYYAVMPAIPSKQECPLPRLFQKPVFNGIAPVSIETSVSGPKIDALGLKNREQNVIASCIISFTSCSSFFFS